MRYGIALALLVLASFHALDRPAPRAAREARSPAPRATSPPVMRSEPPPLPVAPPRTRIVIDPGHGGKDPGGRGRFITDREIATSVARELKVLLAADPRLEAIFTREDDRFVSLDDRLQLTRAAAPAAFISLHANEYRRKGRAFGVEVSYPSERLARRERARLLGPGAAGTLEASMMGGFLFQMQRETIGRSAMLAQHLHDGVVARTGQRGRGTRPAGYHVLRPYETPACLIELGFLSDADEELLMMSPDWQRRAAEGIRSGLVAWLDATPLVLSSAAGSP